MAEEPNHFKIIFDRLKSMIEGTDYTKHIDVFGGEPNVRKRYPIVTILAARQRDVRQVEHVGRRRNLPMKVWYDFTISIAVRVHDLDTTAFGSEGITQQWMYMKRMLKEPAYMLQTAGSSWTGL